MGQGPALLLMRGRRAAAEPVAAALAYGLGRTADEALILVFDLGGGTFDCSLVEAFEGCLEARRWPPPSAFCILAGPGRARPAHRPAQGSCRRQRLASCCAALGWECAMPASCDPPEAPQSGGLSAVYPTLPYLTLQSVRPVRPERAGRAPGDRGGRRRAAGRRRLGPRAAGVAGRRAARRRAGWRRARRRLCKGGRGGSRGRAVHARGGARRSSQSALGVACVGGRGGASATRLSERTRACDSAGRGQRR